MKIHNKLVKFFSYSLVILILQNLNCQTITERHSFTQQDVLSNKKELKKEINFKDDKWVYSYKPYIKPKHPFQKNMEILLALNTAIDSLKYDNSTLTIYTNFDKKVEREAEFYGFISDSYAHWYCKWNDLYSVLFALNEIENIIWINNRKLSTIFPSSEEWNQVHPPQYIMKRKWFYEDLDYSLIITEDNSYVSKDFVLENEKHVDSLLQSKPHTRKTPPKCF